MSCWLVKAGLLDDRAHDFRFARGHGPARRSHFKNQPTIAIDRLTSSKSIFMRTRISYRWLLSNWPEHGATSMKTPRTFPVCSLKIDFCAQTLLRRTSACEPKEGSELTEAKNPKTA